MQVKIKKNKNLISKLIISMPGIFNASVQDVTSG